MRNGLLFWVQQVTDVVFRDAFPDVNRHLSVGRLELGLQMMPFPLQLEVGGILQYTGGQGDERQQRLIQIVVAVAHRGKILLPAFQAASGQRLACVIFGGTGQRQGVDQSIDAPEGTDRYLAIHGHSQYGMSRGLNLS